jgi:putative ABC transport system ATP-binding protein
VPFALTFTNVVKRHPGLSAPVLDDITVALECASTLAIIGASGSGKSTLLNIAAGLESVDAGQVCVGGVTMAGQGLTIDDDTADVRKTHIGFVFQSFLLLPYLTAIDNAALPLQLAGLSKPMRRERARSMLALLGLEHRSHAWPRELSGGEMQRVAMARALIHEPTLVLADEPTGNLDEDTSQQTLDVLFNALAATKAACLLVTHARSAAARADRVAVLSHGKLTLPG